MAKILLSIKPEYVEKILNREKKFEFRKRLPKSEISEVYIYSSYPEKVVVGKFTVKNILKLTPTEMWESTKEASGIGKKEFFKYFENKEYAYAYEIDELTIFKEFKKLGYFNVKFAPQSFVYI